MFHNVSQRFTKANPKAFSKNLCFASPAPLPEHFSCFGQRKSRPSGTSTGIAAQEADYSAGTKSTEKALPLPIKSLQNEEQSGHNKIISKANTCHLFTTKSNTRRQELHAFSDILQDLLHRRDFCLLVLHSAKAAGVEHPAVGIQVGIMFQDHSKLFTDHLRPAALRA